MNNITLKNTALVLTSSTIITIFVLVGIITINPQIGVDLVMRIWVNWWEFNVLGYIILGTICVAALLTFVFASGKKLRISYILGVTTGVFLGIFMDMMIYMDTMLQWIP